jgi:integrase
MRLGSTLAGKSQLTGAKKLQRTESSSIMASISRDKDKTGRYNGCRTLQFFDAEGTRKSVRLGKVTAKTAQSIRAKIEAIQEAKYAQLSWDRETSEWVANLDPKLYDKLAAACLLPTRKKVEIATVGTFVDSYITGREHKLAKSTRDNYRQTRDDLVTYFGSQTPLTHVTPGDADEWRIWLAMDKDSAFAGHPGRGLSENSARKRCGIARQFFNAAKKKHLISDNPFAEIQGGVSVRANKEREQFVPRDTVDQVIAACSDVEFKLVLALARYAGLRCPSELSLTWSDIDWDRGRLTVRSPKTAHHAGKELRVIPLFYELRPHLEAVRAARAGSTSPFILSEKYRRFDANLRTPLKRILERLGLKPWPKLFQNLRASRATEFATDFAPHIAAAWAGHSEKVAEQHYWRVNDEDIEKALQKCMQQPDATSYKDIQVDAENPANSAEMLELAGCSVLPVGIEPTTY